MTLHVGQARVRVVARGTAPLEFTLALMGDEIPDRGMVHHLQHATDHHTGEVVVSWIRED